ncbi:hypothetical protein [Zhihengliuella flava]|uniref:Membrane protein YccC n=1 Tax=Zhihengliuella flava TaxID=1285193 RepID=A0A931GFJ7_9MICC|nr:hypothetical protein [Zhihengliuella flava]MBG6084737.1 putative membrane protein YccC [Zhihengliuella flava]
MKSWPRWLKVLQLVVFVGLLATQIPLALGGQWFSWIVAGLAVAGIVVVAVNWSAPKTVETRGT